MKTDLEMKTNLAGDEQISEDEQPILRTLQTKNLAKRPTFCHEEYRNNQEQLVDGRNQDFQPASQSAEHINTRHYPNHSQRHKRLL